MIQPRPWASLALVLALAPAARAQGVVVVHPAEVDEGRPVTLRVGWVHKGDQARALLSLVARGGAEPVTWSGVVERDALFLAPLADEALTLDLEATEDLGPVARAPAPPVVGQLGGVPCRILRLVEPGETVAVELPLVPSAGPLEVQVTVETLTFPEPGPLGAVTLYVPGGTQRWAPGESADEPDPDAGPELGPPGARGGRRVDVAVHLTRWSPRAIGPSPEVLVRKDALAAIAPARQQLAAQVTVRPAKFGLAAAKARAALEPTAAVRLLDDRWLLQDATRVALVAEQGAVTTQPGALLPWALGLARDGRASLRWYEGAERPELVKALEEAGFVRNVGKGIDLEVTTEKLTGLLSILEQHGMTLRDGRLVAR